LGKPHHKVEADTADQTELRLTTELGVGQGFWIAAHAESLDGSQAHTTPIYVTRKGLRHWDVATAAALIDRQMDVLREIDGEVRSAETLIDGGGRLFDYWNRRTAEQADRIRIKIDETRQIYEDLQAQLERQILSTPRP